MKRIALVVCLILLVWLATSGQEIQLPHPTGYVNDLAHLLDQTHSKQLEQELREYERSTGIELAVLTVPSLQDLTVDQFAQGVFEQWRIGKKGEDNGVLFLIVPNPDRKLRIQTGYGMEPFLIDGQCGEILRLHVVPYTRQEQWQTGIVEGVHSIITTLGTRTLTERNTELAKKKQQEQELQRQAEQLICPTLVVLILGWLCYWFVRRWQLSRDIKQMADKCRSLLTSQQANADKKTQAQLSLLKELTGSAFDPKWQGSVDSYPAACVVLSKRISQLISELPSSLEFRRQVLKDLGILLKVSIPYLDVVSSLQREIDSAKSTASSAPVKLNTLPTVLANAHEEVGAPGAPELARSKWKAAERNLAEANSLFIGSDTNWYQVGLLLLACERDLEIARQASHVGSVHFARFVGRGGSETSYVAPSFRADGTIHRDPYEERRTPDNYGSYNASPQADPFSGFGGGGSGGGGASADA